MSTSKLVLICIDGSEHSSRALKWYFNEVHHKRNEVGLVHVHIPPNIPVGFGIHGNEQIIANDFYRQAVQETISASKAVVEMHKEKCMAQGVTPKVFLKTLDDSAGHTICTIAQENNASLIVVGQRGLGAIRRTLFGSVSDYILHHARIPVLVSVPPGKK